MRRRRHGGGGGWLRFGTDPDGGVAGLPVRVGILMVTQRCEGGEGQVPERRKKEGGGASGVWAHAKLPKGGQLCAISAEVTKGGSREGRWNGEEDQR